MNKKSKNIETIAIHGSMNHKSGAKSVVPPIEMSTNFVHSKHGRKEGDFVYTRLSNPNREQLEHVLSELEGGEACCAFSSGMAAISAVLQTVERGAHILVPNDVYHGTRTVLLNFSENWGIEYSFIDMTNIEEIEGSIQKNTSLIYVETPSNPLIKITDLEAVNRICKANRLKLCVDNTWPTPFNSNPIEFGADYVVHSTTKYLAGHSDIIGGAVIVADKEKHYEKLNLVQKVQGGIPSPQDSWLLTRSIRSFPYRMRAHNENAQKVAEFLTTQSKVSDVFYPGLESHEGHEIAKAQMRGFGGMISFLIDGTEEETLKVVASSELITRATSLGGVESIWEHRKSTEGEGSNSLYNLIRLSVGIEHVEDIIADIGQALKAIH